MPPQECSAQRVEAPDGNMLPTTRLPAVPIGHKYAATVRVSCAARIRHARCIAHPQTPPHRSAHLSLNRGTQPTMTGWGAILCRAGYHRLGWIGHDTCRARYRHGIQPGSVCRAAWDTVPCGIPCRVGYRSAWYHCAAWDTVPVHGRHPARRQSSTHSVTCVYCADCVGKSSVAA